MAPWFTLNTTGRLLLVCCIINVVVSVFFAKEGEAICAIFSLIMAVYCGLSTYHPKYQYKDAKDINDPRR